MRKTAFIISLLLLTNISFCQSFELKDYQTQDSLASLIVNAGYELRIASNQLYASMGTSILSVGCLVGSFLLPEDASRDGSGNMVLRVVGYGSALAATLFYISGIGHIDKAGIYIGEYGLGLKVPISGQ